jgi:periplasmic divalent cation tolerance protein
MSQESSKLPDAAWPAEQAVAELRTTFPSRHDALACGTRLVEQGLAACVQIEGPLTSVYRWQGVVETAEEYACRAKTTPTAAAACEAAMRSLHPYEIPEILISVSYGSVGYAAWVHDNVATDTEARE